MSRGKTSCPKSQGAKRPGPKRLSPKSPEAKTLPEPSLHNCETSSMIVTILRLLETSKCVTFTFRSWVGVGMVLRKILDPYLSSDHIWIRSIQELEIIRCSNKVPKTHDVTRGRTDSSYSNIEIYIYTCSYMGYTLTTGTGQFPQTYTHLALSLPAELSLSISIGMLITP